MDSSGVRAAVRTKFPLTVLLLVLIALAVVGLLLAKAAIGIFLGIVRLALILVAFTAIAIVGLYLWRRGERGSRS